MSNCGYDNFKDNNNLYIHDISLKENKIEIDSVVFGLLQKIALNPYPIKFYCVDDIDCIVISLVKPNPIIFFNENDVNAELLKLIKPEPIRFSNINDVNIELKKRMDFKPIKFHNKNDIDIVLKSFVKPRPIRFRGVVGKYVDGNKIADGLSVKLRRLRKLSDLQQDNQMLLSNWQAENNLTQFLYKEV